MRKIRKKGQKRKIWILWRKRKDASARERAARDLAAFFLFMLLFTIISRWIYAYQMPRVIAGCVSSKSISHTFDAKGVIEPAKEEAVILMEGIRICQIYVKAGERVEADTLLMQLDEEDLKSLLQETNEKIRITKEKIAALQSGVSLDGNAFFNQGVILEEQQMLARLQKQRDGYQELLVEKGQVESGVDGYVTEICVKTGDRTPDRAAMILAVCADVGWIFRAELTQDQADQVKAGDAVRLQFRDGAIQEDGCPVTAVRKTGKGTYEAIVPVTADRLSPGEDGTMEMTSFSGQYACCVPLSAIYADADKNYVLLIRETDTILGKELSVVRRDVVIADQNESTAALEDGALGAEDQFVVYANKTASSGDKVRLFEEEDGLLLL